MALVDSEVKLRQRDGLPRAFADPVLRQKVSQRTKACIAAKMDRQFADLITVWSATPDEVRRRFTDHVRAGWGSENGLTSRGQVGSRCGLKSRERNLLKINLHRRLNRDGGLSGERTPDCCCQHLFTRQRQPRSSDEPYARQCQERDRIAEIDCNSVRQHRDCALLVGVEIGPRNTLHCAPRLVTDPPGAMVELGKLKIY
jgi:hypothetical protein